MFIPFDAPAALFYFSGNVTAKGGSILPLDPVSFSVVPREGKYYLNGNPNPTVTLTRGAKFSFVIRNEDQRLFPIVFGSSFGNPYTAAGAITVAKGEHIHTYIHTYIRTSRVRISLTVSQASTARCSRCRSRIPPSASSSTTASTTLS